MLLTFFITTIFCIVSLHNLPLGYSLYLTTKLFVPPIAKIGVGDVMMSFHTFFLLFFICLLFIKKYKVKALLSDYVVKITIIWIVMTIIIGLMSGDVPIIYSIKGIMELLREYILILIAWIIFYSPKQIDRFFSLLFVVVYISCIYGIYEYLTKDNPYMEYIVTSFDGIPMWDQFHNDVRGFINGRIQSLTYHPLFHGQMMQIVFPFVVIYERRNKVVGGKLLELLILLNIVFTGSRAALISTFLFIMLMIINKQNFRKSIILIFSILLVGLAVGTKVSGEIGSTFKSMIFFWSDNNSEEIRGSSVDSRLAQYAYMVYDLGVKLPIGHGLGYARFDYEENGDHPIMHGYESIILRKITETGLIGFVLYLIWYFMIYLYLKIYISASPMAKYNREIKYMILTSFVSLFLTGEFSYSLYFLLIFVFYRYCYLYKARL